MKTELPTASTVTKRGTYAMPEKPPFELSYNLTILLIALAICLTVFGSIWICRT